MCYNDARELRANWDACHSQIQWVEEEYEVFALEITQTDLLEFSFDHSDAAEVRRRLAD